MTAPRDTAKGHRIRRRVGLLALVTALLVVSWWAGRETLTPRESTQDRPREQVTAEVVEASVGRSITVGVTLSQPVEPIATNHLAGVVTAVDRSDSYQLGAVAYSVAGVPVRLVVGSTPFYRPLTRNVQGEDVRQLQLALRDLDYTTAAPDARFGSATERAVRAWQRNLGVQATGTVALGELVAVPAQPASLRLGAAVRLGAVLTGGEDAVLGRTGSQDFTLVLSEEQARLIGADTVIRVSYGVASWDAVVDGSRVDENGDSVLILAAVGGGPVCGSECETLPGDEIVNLRGEAVIVPEVTGPAVPVSAVRTGSDGSSYVVRGDGVEREVTVLGSGQGLAVVGGLALGEQVLVSEPSSSLSDGA